MKSANVRNAISLVMNAATAVLVLISVLWFFTGDGAGNMLRAGSGCFVYFTVDSNILAALCCLVLIPFNVKALISGKYEMPKWAMLLKFVGTVAVTLTLTVVVLLLGPTMGYKMMFEGVCLELHLICPVLCILSFCIFELGYSLSKKQSWWGVVPTLIYGTLYLVMVVFLKRWEDFYGFNIGGLWYVSYVALPAVTYGLARLVRAAHNRSENKEKEASL